MRYLRDEGVDAHLLLFKDEMDYFLPWCDTFDLSYQSFVHQLNWGSFGRLFLTPKSKIQKDLEGYDYYVGCGPAPAYMHKVGKKLDIFVPYGSDIWSQTFYKFSDPLSMISHNYSVFFQKRGIRDSKVFHMPHTNSLYETRYNKLKGKGERWFEQVPLVYHKVYDANSVKKEMDSSAASTFRQIRERSEFMVIAHSRQYWKDIENCPDDKSNDKLFKAWAVFLKKNPTAKAHLVVFEHGKDVDASKQLSHQLNIESSVVWMPKMFRKDLMPGVFMSDLVCGEFKHSWIGCGVLHEAMVAKKPILAYREDSLYDESELYFILNAASIEEISSCLEDFYLNKNQYQEYGEKGFSWYSRNVFRGAINRYLKFFFEKKSSFEVLTVQVLSFILGISSLDELECWLDLV